MRSPFPGMDPYLEGDDWTSFHTLFATEIARQLATKLRPKYVVLPEKRFDIVDAGSLAIESVYPEVSVSRISSGTEGFATAAIASPPFVLETDMDERAPHSWVEVRDSANRRLATTIEILSPWNKRVAGREDYFEKGRKLFKSTAHLIEIYFLRPDSGCANTLRKACP